MPPSTSIADQITALEVSKKKLREKLVERLRILGRNYNMDTRAEILGIGRTGFCSGLQWNSLRTLAGWAEKLERNLPEPPGKGKKS